MGGWGRQFLAVTPAGKVLPCHAAETLTDMTFETVHERPLADIWRDGPAFERFRGTDWMPEPCRSCDRRTADFGGCRCQAFAITGDAATTDPACEFSPYHETMLRLAETESASGADAFAYRGFAARPPTGRVPGTGDPVA
jgi:pyrroloquinoline quinone biosynthesis protein E